ncbi:MAG: hypothetical protein ACPGQL_00650 [Thermoplasmatota archaeon]
MLSVRAWVAIGTFVVALVLSSIGAATEASFVNFLGGLLLISALVVAVSGLPVFARLRATVEPMPDLFAAPGPGQRWCAACGRPTPEGAACAHCNDPGKGPAGRKRKR